MRVYHAIVALSLIAVPISCAAAQAPLPDAAEGPSPTPAHTSGPMASFVLMEAGEWRLGTVQADTWRWGPGEHSISAHTVGSDGGGNPWRELAVYYWHPGHKQIRVLSLHPDIPALGRGVAEGSVEFDGQTFTGVMDLYQAGHPTRKHRRMATRWTFDGPDRYHEALLENSGRGFETLAEWDYVRSMERGQKPPRHDGEAPAPSENLKPFVPLLGGWEELRDGDVEGAHHSRLSFEWAEYLDIVAVRLDTANPDQSPSHRFDVYLYHHVGAGTLRCLALSGSGGVYEGDVTLLPDGALQSELRGFEGDQETGLIVRLGFEDGGTLRGRVWAVAGDDRTLSLDVRYGKLAPDPE